MGTSKKAQMLFRRGAAFAVMVFLVSCTGAVQRENPAELFSTNPVTIKWDGDARKGIESFQANVEIHSMNNRKDDHPTLRETYRLAMKKIDGKIYTRIDFQANEAYGIAARSIVSNDTEIIFFDPVTENIEYRIPLESSVRQMNSFQHAASLGQINLSKLRSEAKKLAFDISENEQTRSIIIAIPPHFFGLQDQGNIISAQVRFDTAMETLESAETIFLKADGTRVTTTTTNLYEEKNGIPIKIGSVTEIDSDDPNKVPNSDFSGRIYNTPEDIPIISHAEFEAANQYGQAQPTGSIIFGDPADLSYKETCVELYQNIEINTVSSRIFKLLLTKGTER